MKEIYEVLEVEGKSGLTVGSHCLAPGSKFNASQWPYGSESLKKAVEQKRCKLVSGSSEKKPAEKEKEKGDK